MVMATNPDQRKWRRFSVSLIWGELRILTNKWFRCISWNVNFAQKKRSPHSRWNSTHTHFNSVGENDNGIDRNNWEYRVWYNSLWRATQVRYSMSWPRANWGEPNFSRSSQIARGQDRKAHRILNNYSRKWRWVAVDIYRAASAR